MNPLSYMIHHAAWLQNHLEPSRLPSRTETTGHVSAVAEGSLCSAQFISAFFYLQGESHSCPPEVLRPHLEQRQPPTWLVFVSEKPQSKQTPLKSRDSLKTLIRTPCSEQHIRVLYASKTVQMAKSWQTFVSFLLKFCCFQTKLTLHSFTRSIFFLKFL